ncbi:MAG: vWA domain-containing protein [Gammaproteobacteria bacterium]
MFEFTVPAALLLSVLAIVPLLSTGQASLPYSACAMVPDDRLSTLLDWFLRLLMAACIISIVFGVAGLHRSAHAVEKVGQGAQMVVLLDSSGSMDRPFASLAKTRGRAPVWGTYESKGQTARRLLAKFVEQRPQDLFAIFSFSRNPIEVVPLTNKQEVVKSAIRAGGIERGLGTTDLAAGLMRASAFFRDRPFTGSRIVMLFSDGSAALTLPMQDQIKYLMERYKVTLYWIYLRDIYSPGLFKEVDAELAEKIAPEQLVHKFFVQSGLPYRAFSADDPEALQDAIREVGQLQDLPMHYSDVVPRKDLSPYCYGVALALLSVLIIARVSEVSRWQ